MNVEVDVFSAVVGLLVIPYECGGGCVLSRGRFVNKPTAAENTSTSTFIWNPEAETAV